MAADDLTIFNSLVEQQRNSNSPAVEDDPEPEVEVTRLDIRIGNKTVVYNEALTIEDAIAELEKLLDVDEESTNSQGYSGSES